MPCRSPRLLPLEFQSGGQTSGIRTALLQRAVSDLTHVDLDNCAASDSSEHLIPLRGVWSDRTWSLDRAASLTSSPSRKTTASDDPDLEHFETPRSQLGFYQATQAPSGLPTVPPLDLSKPAEEAPTNPAEAQHQPLAPNKEDRPLCRHFLAGKCSKGIRCRFRHDEGEDASPTFAAPKKMGKKLHRLPTFGPARPGTPEQPAKHGHEHGQPPHYPQQPNALQYPAHGATGYAGPPHFGMIPFEGPPYHAPAYAQSAGTGYAMSSSCTNGGGYHNGYGNGYDNGWSSYGQHTPPVPVPSATMPAYVASPSVASHAGSPRLAPLGLTSPPNSVPALSPTLSAVRGPQQPTQRENLKASLEKMRADAAEQARFHAEQAQALEILLRGIGQEG